MKRFPLFVPMVAAMVMAGCFLSSCQGGHKTSAQWTQEGAFGRMPPPGDYDGYSVEKFSPPGSQEFYLVGHVEPVVDESTAFYQNGSIHVILSSDDELSDSDAGQRISDMFAALGLGTPTLDRVRFHRSYACG